MQRIYTTLLLSLFSGILFAQQQSKVPTPRFTKQAIATTGCYAYLPEGVNWAEQTKSPDSSDIFQCSRTYEGGYELGLIFVHFSAPFNTLTQPELEDLLISYSDYLKGSFNIKSAVGYGRGHRLAADTTVIGVIDYWEDKDKKQMSVQGWINPEYLAFYYILGPDNQADKFRSIFFNGLRLPD